jgi:hypothetical protein
MSLSIRCRLTRLARTQRAERHESRYAVLHRETDHQHGPHLEPGKPRGFSRQVAARLGSVADLDDAHVAEPVAQVRQGFEQVAAQDFRVERGVQAGGAAD